MSEKINPMANVEPEESEAEEGEVKGLALVYQDGNWSIMPIDDHEALTEEELYSFCWQFVGSFLSKPK